MRREQPWHPLACLAFMLGFCLVFWAGVALIVGALLR
jgi:hypothetical protein